MSPSLVPTTPIGLRMTPGTPTAPTTPSTPGVALNPMVFSFGNTNNNFFYMTVCFLHCLTNFKKIIDVLRNQKNAIKRKI